MPNQVKQSKKIGDNVKITAGQHKNNIGIITGKERHGWIITLNDQETVTIPFPLVILAEAADELKASEPPEASCEEAAEISVTDDDQKEEGTPIAQEEASRTSSCPDENTEISKLTVKELWTLAHQRGISIARTKADFCRIIQELNPQEDLTALKGQVLYNRVKELHISRLRSKDDLIKLLA